MTLSSGNAHLDLSFGDGPVFELTELLRGEVHLTGLGWDGNAVSKSQIRSI
jgi:hypothetical protein